MAVTFDKINTLSDVDFESLYDASFPDININFFNKVPKEMTEEQKKQYYFNQCNSAVNGLSPLQKEGESFFGFKIVVDGVDRVLNAGFLEVDGTTYRGHWYLTSPINGSRSFIYSAETAAVRQAFFESEGITHYKAPTFAGSLMYRALQRNNTSNVISIVDQVDNPAIPDGVVIKVQV